MNTRRIYNETRRIYGILPTNLLIFFTLFLITFYIFLFFTTKVKHFPLNLYSIAVITAMSILVGYLRLLVKYISSNINSKFSELRPSFKKRDFLRFSHNAHRILQKSLLYYLIVILVMSPFATIQLIEVLKWKWGLTNVIPNFFYLNEPTTWSLLLDIFNQVVAFFILFMLAKIIWMMIRLIIFISELWDKNNQNKYKIKINVFDVEKNGGLRSLNSFVLFIVSNYFIIIALFIISYIPTKEKLTVEIIVLIIMLFIGIMLFFTTQKTIKNLIGDRIAIELEIINQKIKETHEKVIEICSNKKTNIDKIELEKLQVILDILEKEKIRIKQIKEDTFDIKTMSTFFTSVILPSFSLILKMYPSLPEEVVSLILSIRSRV